MVFALDVLFTLICFAIINRARGFRDWQPDWMKGRPLYYMTAVVLICGIAKLGLYGSLAFSFAYFFWGVFPWGRWYDLGELPQDYTGAPSALEKSLEAISFGTDYVALTWRHLFILPGMLAVAYVIGYPLWVAAAISVVFAILATTMYSFGKIVYPKAHTIIGEYGVGVLWGAVYVATWSMR